MGNGETFKARERCLGEDLQIYGRIFEEGAIKNNVLRIPGLEQCWINHVRSELNINLTEMA